VGILIRHGEKHFKEELLFFLLLIYYVTWLFLLQKGCRFSFGERKKREEGGS
jgi:hypothetical protein